MTFHWYFGDQLTVLYQNIECINIKARFFLFQVPQDTVKCYDLCAVDDDDVLALGYASGRILVTKSAADENLK